MKNLTPFALERYFARYEFNAEYLLSCSDCEAFTLAELLQYAKPEIMKLWENLKLGYTETMGHPRLRKSISDIYEDLEEDNIMVAVPQECIFLTMNTILESGDHVICTFPAYQSLHEVARSIGCDVTLWNPDEERDWHFDIQWLQENIHENTRLVIVNFPHNPTGHIPLKEDFQNLVDMLREKNIYLFSDEMYRFLEVEKGSTLPPACDLYEKGFSMSGLSKTFGLPGLRIGWIATQDPDTLEKISHLKDYTTICSSAPSEILGIMALESREHIIRKQLDRIERNVGVLDEFFSEYDGCLNWNRPKGGSICFPKLLAADSSYEFCEELVKDCGIMLAPSSMFGYDDHHVRIGFGREDLPEVLERFTDYLDKRFRS
jgi:aspartate/methionine/tyrosine aminotransferase